MKHRQPQSQPHPLPDWFLVLGVVLAAILSSVGVVWALTKGGQDFAVFYSAGQTVLQGRAAEVYHLTPDRFLYAPGFAWWMAPFALLPQELALALFSFLKVACLGLVVATLRDLARAEGTDELTAWGLAAWSVVLVARPLLIDFQYGQVNLLFLCFAIFALAGLFDRRQSQSAFKVGLKWFLLATAATSKLILLPLLGLPFWTRVKSKDRAQMARAGVIAGVLLVMLLPLTLKGFPQWVELHRDWFQALEDRGFPRESHNQSFLAVLYHLLSGVPTHVLGLYAQRDFTLFNVTHFATLGPALGWSWSLIWGSLILGLLVSAKNWNQRFLQNPMQLLGQWSFLLALLILPSHLIWKPYFVFALPFVFYSVWIMWRDSSGLRLSFILTYFILGQILSKDILGPERAAWFEAAGAMLWAYLLVLLSTKIISQKKA